MSNPSCNKIGFIDSHIHFDLISKELAEIDRIILEAIDTNVMKMVAIGGNVESNDFALKIAMLYPNYIYSAIGYNRDCCPEEKDFLTLEEQLKTNKTIAIGEIGLDYYRLTQPRNLQIALFERMLKLAVSYRKPVIIHSRQAKEDTLAMVREYRAAGGVGGVLHCFTDDLSFAEALIEAGITISFSGIVTFKNAHQIRNVISALPLNKILIETDSPYLTPEPCRKENNRPAMVKYIAETIAKLKKIEIEELNYVIFNNFMNTFKLNP